MVKWVCTHCNFRFEASNPKDCPYCGKIKIRKEPSAEELLEEVDKILEE